MHSLRTPLVDKGRDEIDARLIGDDKSLLQTTSHAQGSKTKLSRWSDFIVIAHIDLSKIFHIMYIQSHHVPQSVRHKQGMCSGSNGLVHIATHQAQFLQSTRQRAAHFQMHLFPGITRTGMVDGAIMSSHHNVVNLLLALCEASAHRHGAGEVRTVVHVRLRSGIGQHQTPPLKDVAMIVVVKRLAIHGENRGKRHTGPMSQGNAFDGAGNQLLLHTGFTQAHGRGVHLVPDVTSTFYFSNLQFTFYRAQIHYSLD